MKFNKSLLAVALGLAAFGASAQTTGTINVSAAVTASCNIAVTPLAFGSYNSLSASATQANSTVQITCSQGSVPVIALAGGSNLVGTQRALKDTAVGGTALLNYSIFQPSSNAASAACAYTTAWGDGSALGGVLTATAAPNLSARTYNVCGSIPAGQNVPVANYSDAVVATVSF